MLAKLKNRLNNRKGFTLVELIVVIAIIAILAAVLLPQMAGFTKKAKNSNTLSEAKNIATAFATLVAEKPNVDIAAVDTVIGPSTTGTLATALRDMAGNFQGTITVDSSKAINVTNGVNFTYTNATVDSGYTVTVTNGQAKAN